MENVKKSLKCGDLLVKLSSLLQKGLKIAHHADTTLSSFCAWQKNLNPQSDTHPAHHDLAVLITRQVSEVLPLSHSGSVHVPYVKWGGMCNNFSHLFPSKGKIFVQEWTSHVRLWVSLIYLGCVNPTAAATSTRIQDCLSPSLLLMKWATGSAILMPVKYETENHHKKKVPICS